MTDRAGDVLEHCRSLRTASTPESQSSHFQYICRLADQDDECRSTLASELASSASLRQLFLHQLKNPASSVPHDLQI